MKNEDAQGDDSVPRLRTIELLYALPKKRLAVVLSVFYLLGTIATALGATVVLAVFTNATPSQAGALSGAVFGMGLTLYLLFLLPRLIEQVRDEDNGTNV